MFVKQRLSSFGHQDTECLQSMTTEATSLECLMEAAKNYIASLNKKPTKLRSDKRIPLENRFGALSGKLLIRSLRRRILKKIALRNNWKKKQIKLRHQTSSAQHRTAKTEKTPTKTGEAPIIVQEKSQWTTIFSELNKHKVQYVTVKLIPNCIQVQSAFQDSRNMCNILKKLRIPLYTYKLQTEKYRRKSKNKFKQTCMLDPIQQTRSAERRIEKDPCH